MASKDNKRQTKTTHTKTKTNQDMLGTQPTSTAQTNQDMLGAQPASTAKINQDMLGTQPTTFCCGAMASSSQV